jgi:hypothetical protein
MRHGQCATDEVFLYLQAVFSQARSRDEPQGGVQPVDELPQAANELHSLNEPFYSHSNGLLSPPFYSHSSE